MVLLFSTVSVDTFIFISGFLISWNGLRKLKNSNGKLSILYVYIHRYLRLTPLLAVVILIVVSWLKFLGQGPNWNRYLDVHREACLENWWKTLLYIQNYVTPMKMVMYFISLLYFLNSLNIFMCIVYKYMHATVIKLWVDQYF